MLQGCQVLDVRILCICAYNMQADVHQHCVLQHFALQKWGISFEGAQHTYTYLASTMQRHCAIVAAAAQ